MKISNFLLVSALTLAVTFPAIISCSNSEDTPYNPTERYEYEIVKNSLQTYTISQVMDNLGKEMPIKLDNVELSQMPSIPGMPSLSEISLDNLDVLLPFLKLLIGKIDNIEEVLADNTSYSTCVMKFKSIDTKGNPIWLSGRLYFRRDNQGNFIAPNHVVLANHYTVCSNAQTSSSEIGLYGVIAHNNALVVAPDYLGYGETVSKDHPYCIPDITARNTLDMVRAARQYFDDNGIKEIGNLPLYNIGYSQGGISALAVAKFVQTDAQAKKEFTLANTYCGGGPYCMPRIYKDNVERNTLAYPIIIPMIIIGFKDYFPDLFNLDYKDYFSDAINKAGIIDYIKKKSNTDFEIMDSIAKVIEPLPSEGFEIGITVRTSDIVSKEAFRQGSDIYENILKATEMCDMTVNWTPESHVHFMHSKYDEWVDYFNFEAAQEAFGDNPNAYFETIAPLFLPKILGKHMLIGLTYFARTFCGEYLKVYDKYGNVND